MDYHGVIEEGILKGDIAPIYRKGSKDIKRVKFKDGEEMDYTNKKLTQKLKDHLEQLQYHTTAGYKAFKQNIIHFVRERIAVWKTEIKGVVSRDFILNKLLDAKIITTAQIDKLPHEANQYIKTALTKLNNDHFKEQYGQDFERLNEGQHQYELTFKVRVRDNVDGVVKYHNETRHGQFKDDRPKDKIPKTKIEFVIHLYYVWKDYSALDEILDYKIHEIDKTADIKDMELWDIRFGRRYCNKLFKYTTDKISDWNRKAEQENYKQCVMLFLITTYHTLIDKGYISKEVLSEDNIKKHFNNTWTINKLIEFVKGLKHASICIFDSLGIVPICSYSVDDAIVNGNLKDNTFINDTGNVCPKWYKQGLAVISENHIEGLFNKDLIQSATKNGYIKEFTKHISDDDTFDFFEDIERKLMDDTYEEQGKNNDENVLLYQDVQVVETVDMDDENYKALSELEEQLSTTYRMIKYLNFVLNLHITNYIIDGRTSTIIGFIDPRNNKKYLRCDGDYYIRRNIVNHLFNKHRSEDLVWKNQTYAQISNLISKNAVLLMHKN